MRHQHNYKLYKSHFLLMFVISIYQRLDDHNTHISTALIFFQFLNFIISVDGVDDDVYADIYSERKKTRLYHFDAAVYLHNSNNIVAACTQDSL